VRGFDVEVRGNLMRAAARRLKLMMVLRMVPIGRGVLQHGTFNSFMAGQSVGAMSQSDKTNVGAVFVACGHVALCGSFIMAGGHLRSGRWSSVGGISGPLHFVQ
jgi:hypothetical protein